MADGLLRTADGFRAAYRDTLGNVAAMADTLDADSWNLPTGCPGWTVRDLVAHINALESILIGRETPSHAAPEGLPHVRGPAGQFMEGGVDYRRGWPIERLLEEFHEVTSIRLQRLDEINDESLQQDAPAIIGTSKLRGSLTIRVFDLWSHEQDMRRAVQRPGGFEGPAALHSREMLARGIGNNAAQHIHPPEGSSLLLDITGPGGAQRSVAFADGKGRVVDAIPEQPTVSMRLDLNTLAVLGCGRNDDPAARERVDMQGDVDLGRRILEVAAVTP